MIAGDVAPFTGAWIEIIHRVAVVHLRPASHPSRVRGLKLVIFRLEAISVHDVAPFTGAWIEIPIIDSSVSVKSGSHPSRVRGLKYR